MKAANAFLYLALESTAELSLVLPRVVAEAMAKGDASAEDTAKVKAIITRVHSMMENAHQYIWDEDGKPR